MCYFCREVDIEENLVAAGTFHASKTKKVTNNVKKMTETWIDMAKCLADEHLLLVFTHGDVASNEVFYHKANIKYCYQK